MCWHLAVEPTVIQSIGYHDIKVLAPARHLGADLRGLGIWETRQIVPPTAMSKKSKSDGKPFFVFC